jgi:uncharacterized protein YjiS (DUF1127 family)
MGKSEARSGFNYTTRAYRQASARPGFWECYFRIRNARCALERLPDHMLKDIGMRYQASAWFYPGRSFALQHEPLRCCGTHDLRQPDRLAR